MAWTGISQWRKKKVWMGILGLKTKKRGRYDIDGRVANDTINETGDGLMCI